MATGSLFVISAPSGAGKTSLIKELIGNINNLELSISYTTRPKRPGEVDGKHYHFISLAEFSKMQEQGDFFESAEVFGNHYGTSEAWLKKTMASGRDVLLEIDWQGAQQIAKLVKDCIKLFILPPSKAALEERLKGRGEDSDEDIKLRVKQALVDIKYYVEYDYIVVNDDFADTLSNLQAIVTSCQYRLIKQDSLVKGLISKFIDV